MDRPSPTAPQTVLRRMEFSSRSATASASLSLYRGRKGPRSGDSKVHAGPGSFPGVRFPVLLYVLGLLSRGWSCQKCAQRSPRRSSAERFPYFLGLLWDSELFPFRREPAGSQLPGRTDGSKGSYFNGQPPGAPAATISADNMQARRNFEKPRSKMILGLPRAL